MEERFFVGIDLHKTQFTICVICGDSVVEEGERFKMICSWWKDNGYPFDEKKDRLESVICEEVEQTARRIKSKIAL